MSMGIEERVDSLETILGSFIVQTGSALTRLEREMADFKDEMAEFKDEMRDFKDEMRDFKDEMRDFKDEMAEFKDEMIEFKDEMTGFKDEMTGFKDEMTGFKSQVNKQWGELANKMGTVVEDIVAPNIPYVAERYFGVAQLDYFAVRARKRHPDRSDLVREFDVIAVGGGKFFVNDTKSTPRSEYLSAFAENYREAVEYFPEFGELDLVPIFSSLSIPEEAEAFLSKHGIYAMTSSGGTMEIVNYEAVAG